MSLLERCPHFRGCYVQASMELGPEDVSLLERCPHFRGWYVQASMELGPEDVSLLERCPHFRGWYVQASMELGLIIPVQSQVDLSTAKPHVHHIVYVGGSGIAGKVSIQEVLLKIVEMESLGRESVRPCHLVFWGRGGDGGLDLL